eukprot:353402-Chlamydomonas_euryale.AAC.2
MPAPAPRSGSQRASAPCVRVCAQVTVARRALRCQVCRQPYGAPIQCAGGKACFAVRLKGAGRGRGGKLGGSCTARSALRSDATPAAAARTAIVFILCNRTAEDSKTSYCRIFSNRTFQTSQAFHPLCARNAGLAMVMQEGDEQVEVRVGERHVPACARTAGNGFSR